MKVDIRDQIAIQAMQAIIQAKSMPDSKYAAKYAYEYADAMLRERDIRKNTESYEDEAL